MNANNEGWQRGRRPMESRLDAVSDLLKAIHKIPVAKRSSSLRMLLLTIQASDAEDLGAAIGILEEIEEIDPDDRYACLQAAIDAIDSMEESVGSIVADPLLGIARDIDAVSENRRFSAVAADLSYVGRPRGARNVVSRELQSRQTLNDLIMDVLRSEGVWMSTSAIAVRLDTYPMGAVKQALRFMCTTKLLCRVRVEQSYQYAIIGSEICWEPEGSPRFFFDFWEWPKFSSVSRV